MLTISVVGCGHWGPNLVRSLASHPRCKLSHVCDIDPARLKTSLASVKGVQSTTDYRELLQDPQLDAVAIATPVGTHYKIVLDFLEAGKHVLVEKPLTGQHRTSEQLVRLAEKKQKVLMVGYVFLFNPAVRRAALDIGSGELGDIQYVQAMRTNLGPIRDDINALWDLASHDVSVLLYCLQEIPIRVSCVAGQFIGTPHSDVASLTLSFASGRMAFIYVSWLDPRKVRQTTFVGSRKMLLFDDLNVLEPLRIYDKGVVKHMTSDSYGSHLMAVRTGDVLIPYVSGPEPLACEIDTFVKAVLDGLPNPAIGELPLQVAAILDAADRSFRQGGSYVSVEL
jgi:predicted dehydrogenase